MTDFLAYISGGRSFHYSYHPYHSYYPIHIHHYYDGWGWGYPSYAYSPWTWGDTIAAFSFIAIIFAILFGLNIISSRLKLNQQQADARLTTGELAERIEAAQQHIDDPYKAYDYATELRNINRWIASLAGRNEPDLMQQARHIRQQLRAHSSEITYEF